MIDSATLIIQRARNAYVVCQSCGEKHGRGFGNGKRQFDQSTWHHGRCDICCKRKPVTEFRDFGYSKYPYETNN